MPTVSNALQSPPIDKPRPKSTGERQPIRAEDRADKQRRQAGRAAYKQPVNMGFSEPSVSTQKAITGAGVKLDTKG